MVSGSVFAACSADIDMGGQKITNAAMTVLGTQSEVATKAYVDNLTAGGIRGTELSSLITINGHANAPADKAGYAFAICENLSEGGHSDWRVPTFDELVGLIHTVDTSDDGDIWMMTSTPYNKSNGANNDGSNANGRWLNFSSPMRPTTPGYWGNANHDLAGGSVRCVR
jgi:hypothetical protein